MEIEKLNVNFINGLMATKASTIVDFPFITGVYLSDKPFNNTGIDIEDANFEKNYNDYFNNTLSKKELEKDSQMYIGYKFEIPNGTVVNDGDQFVMNLPNELSKLLIDKTEELKDETGVVIAKVDYKTDNQIIITFTDASKNISDVGGYFWFGRNFNKDNIGNENPVEISFDIPKFGIKKYNMNFKQEPFKEENPKIAKDGVYSAQD